MDCLGSNVVDKKAKINTDTSGNLFLSVNSQLIKPTPSFSKLYPPDLDWLLQQLLLKIPQYSLDKCERCPFRK